MVERTLKDLNHQQKQALRWYAKKFGSTKPADLQEHLDYVSNPDRLDELCEGYERSKVEKRLYEQKKALVARVHKEYEESRGRG